MHSDQNPQSQSSNLALPRGAGTMKNFPCWFLLLSALCAQYCQAIPPHWIAQNRICQTWPEVGVAYGPHGQSGPTAIDTSIKISSATDPTLPISLCAGKTYGLKFDFPEPRGYLLVSSVGTWNTQNTQNQQQDAQCANRVYWPTGTQTGAAKVQSVTASLNVPCTGTTVGVYMTTSVGAGLQHLQNSVNFTIDTTCAAAVCSSPAARAPPPAPADLMQAPPLSQTGLDFINQANNAPSCGAVPYSNGYACTHDLESQFRLQYKLDSSPVPPSNGCTKGATAAATSLTLPAGANAWLHVMISSPATGWVAMSSAQHRGRMYPADAIQGGWIDSSGQGYVDTYHLTDYSLPASDSLLTGKSWALNTGTGMLSLPEPRTVLCYTRAIYVPDGSSPASGAGRKLAQQQQQSSSNIPAVGQVLNLNWAIQSQDDTTSTEHSRAIGFTLNVATGQVDIIDNKLKRNIRAHGALMLAAFVALMPTAILIARHKRLVPKKQVAGKDIWFWLHVYIQVLSVILFAVGIIIAFATFEDGNIPNAANTLTAHDAIGKIIIGVIVFQVLIGVIRPNPNHEKRWMWNILHHNWGRFTLLLTWINIALGIFLYNELYEDESSSKSREPHVAFTAAIVLIVGVLLVVSIILEVMSCASGRRANMQAATAGNGFDVSAAISLGSPRHRIHSGRLTMTDSDKL